MSGETDPDDLQAISAEVAGAAARFEALRATIHIRLRSALWYGVTAEETRRTWDGEIGPAMSHTAGMLRELSATITREVELAARRTAPTVSSRSDEAPDQRPSEPQLRVDS